MNKTRIEWCEFSWNPITGCRNGCWYCYARRIYERFGRSFEPAFHPERLAEPLKRRTPARIFTCSVADPFGSWVPKRWIRNVLGVVNQAQQHTFIFLTKCYDGAIEADFPDNAWVGFTIDDGREAALILDDLAQVRAAVRFASFEPLLSPLHEAADFYMLSWVIIGALTGPGAGKHAPDPTWVQDILDRAGCYSIPVFMKDNLRPYWPGELRQEWPE